MMKLQYVFYLKKYNGSDNKDTVLKELKQDFSIKCHQLMRDSQGYLFLQKTCYWFNIVI